MKIFLTFLLLFATLSNAHAHSLETLTKDTLCVFAYEPQTNTVLFEKEKDCRLDPASLTKMMTAYVVFDQIKHNNIALDDIFITSKYAYALGGTTMFLKTNQKISVQDLLLGLIVTSGNDAARVLAENIAMNSKNFVSLMNKTAKTLKMEHTHYENSTGLFDPQQYTTPYDTALLAAAIIKNFPEYLHIFQKRYFEFSGIRQYNRHPFFSHENPYPGALGFKTGYSEKTGYSVASAGKRGDTTVILVTRTIKKNQKISLDLMDYAFEHFQTRNLNFFKPIALPVQSGSKKSVKVQLHPQSWITLDRFNMPQKAYIYSHRALHPPIHKNDLVATLVIAIPNSKETKMYTLFSQEEIESLDILHQIEIFFNQIIFGIEPLEEM